VGRIASLITLGALLLAVSYCYHRFHEFIVRHL